MNQHIVFLLGFAGMLCITALILSAWICGNPFFGSKLRLVMKIIKQREPTRYIVALKSKHRDKEGEPDREISRRGAMFAPVPLLERMIFFENLPAGVSIHTKGQDGRVFTLWTNHKPPHEVSSYSRQTKVPHSGLDYYLVVEEWEVFNHESKENAGVEEKHALELLES